MEILIIVLILFLFIGFIFRNKEDNLLDTIGKGFNIGCGIIFWFLVIIGLYIYYKA
jgi:hypothetical protein